MRRKSSGETDAIAASPASRYAEWSPGLAATSRSNSAKPPCVPRHVEDVREVDLERLAERDQALHLVAAGRRGPSRVTALRRRARRHVDRLGGGRQPAAMASASSDRAGPSAPASSHAPAAWSKAA